MFLAFEGHAVAPVVDDSDNFTVFDSQGVPAERALPHSASSQEDEPLAKVMPEDKTQHQSLPAQVQSLQQDIQALRGELEVQAHALEQLKQQQLSFYKDLDERLRAAPGRKVKPTHVAAEVVPPSLPDKTAFKPQAGASAAISSPAVATAAVVTSGAPPSNNPANEQISYLAAYDLLKAKRYDAALSAMEAFIRQYPHGGYTANAEYWTGELYMVKNQPAQAIPHFEVVLAQFPTSSKAAASALKIGYALGALGKKEEAKARLKGVIKNYPDTSAAVLAKTKLETF